MLTSCIFFVPPIFVGCYKYMTPYRPLLRKRSTRALQAIEIAGVLTGLMIAYPVATSIFPQEYTMRTESLEKEFQSGNQKFVIFNKGL